MKILLLILYWLVWMLRGCGECHGQNIMPPTNASEYFPVKQFIPDINPQPMGDWTNITLAWDASPSPNIDHYNVYLSPTLRPWVGHLAGSTTNLFFRLYIGGTVMGFPGVSAVNKAGIESGIRL